MEHDHSLAFSLEFLLSAGMVMMTAVLIPAVVVLLKMWRDVGFLQRDVSRHEQFIDDWLKSED
jgi:hypothetical protein